MCKQSENMGFVLPEHSNSCINLVLYRIAALEWLHADPQERQYWNKRDTWKHLLNHIWHKGFLDTKCEFKSPQSESRASGKNLCVLGGVLYKIYFTWASLSLICGFVGNVNEKFSLLHWWVLRKNRRWVAQILFATINQSLNQYFSIIKYNTEIKSEHFLKSGSQNIFFFYKTIRK